MSNIPFWRRCLHESKSQPVITDCQVLQSSLSSSTWYCLLQREPDTVGLFIRISRTPTVERRRGNPRSVKETRFTSTSLESHYGGCFHRGSTRRGTLSSLVVFSLSVGQGSHLPIQPVPVIHFTVLLTCLPFESLTLINPWNTLMNSRISWGVPRLQTNVIDFRP